MRTNITVQFRSIEWDTETDDGDDTPVDLPKEVTRKVEGQWASVEEAGSFVEEQGADILSDAFGWCVHGFDFEVAT